MRRTTVALASVATIATVAGLSLLWVGCGEEGPGSAQMGSSAPIPASTDSKADDGRGSPVDPQSSGVAGISLPPKEGSSNNGMFSDQPLVNTYTQDEIAETLAHKNAIRIGLNPQTVADPLAWSNTQNMADWALQAGATVLFGMWDSKTNDVHKDGHGDGLVDDLVAARTMWQTVGGVYADNPGVYFEAFNEPFGYLRSKPQAYVDDMKEITQDLPQDRVVLAGMGYSSDVQIIKKLWPGLLAYHAYPFWLSKNQTQSNYSNLIQQNLAGVAGRTFVTEFGASLTHAGDYNDSSNPDVNIQFIKGAADAFHAVKPKGTFLWHGYKNGDSYSYWSATPSAMAKVDSAQLY